MGRKVRIVHMPLEPLKNADIKNVLLSHWGLLIGQSDLLLEIFPEKGSTVFTPRNALHVSRSVNLSARKAEFKFGIFRQSNTDKSDDEIIREANAIICRNPYYCLGGYNCQSFVNDLAEAIAIKNFANRFKKAVREWVPILKTVLYRGDDDESTKPVDPAQEAAAELECLIEKGERLRSTVGVEYMIPEVSSGHQCPGQPSELRPFSPKDQPYLLIDEVDDLVSGGYGLVYGLTEDAAFKVADIPVPDNPRDLSSDQKEVLGIAEAFVGREK